jgi:cytochrome c peroxidase
MFQLFYKKSSVPFLCVCFILCCISNCTVKPPVIDNTTTSNTSSGNPNLTELTDAQLRARLQPYILPDDGNFAALPQDPRNPLTPEKIKLGRLLFHDPALHAAPVVASEYGVTSCATCHHAVAGFQANSRQGLGEGAQGFGKNRALRAEFPVKDVDAQAIRSPATLNVAWFENVLWNGQLGATGVNVGTEAFWTTGTRKETNRLGFHGLETQAITGQDVHRTSIDASGIATIPAYATLFAQAFPELDVDKRVSQINAALAMAAYERIILANQAPFQRWLRGDTNAITPQQRRGAQLFFGQAGCVACHNNPGLGGSGFYALGMPDYEEGMPQVKKDSPEHLGRGGFTQNENERFAFKVPQLYNLTDSPFLGHGGTFHSVREVIAYKNTASPANPLVTAKQLSPLFVPLQLSSQDIDALTDFIERALHDPNLVRYEPKQEELPSKACVPNGDELSWRQRSCFGKPPRPAQFLKGFVLENINAKNQRWSFPAVGLAEGGIMVIARNATRAEFEKEWGIMPPWVRFVSANVSSGGGAPIIEGKESFCLISPDGKQHDKNVPSIVGAVYHRTSANSWEIKNSKETLPGIIPEQLRTQGLGLIISKVGDTPPSGDSRFQFVEVAYLP